MKIVITARNYFPVCGGVSVYVRMLATAFQQLQHEVVVITSTPADDTDEGEDAFLVVRRPDLASLIRWAGWADVLLQAELGVKFLLPFLVRRKRCFVSHHTYFTGEDGHTPWWKKIQGHLAANHCQAISVSEIVRTNWGGHGVIISNPYDESLFWVKPDPEKRKTELLFVGRLAEEKGLGVLLQALVHLRECGSRPGLTVIGDIGIPGKSALPRWREEVVALGLQDQVSFMGLKPAADVAAHMRRSQVLVIPSTWEEPFGLIALEGLASGCVVVASRCGGLPEACGGHAILFEKGNAAELSSALIQGLAKAAEQAGIIPQPVCEHLARHQRRPVAERYLRHFSAPTTSLS
ncbi:MAG: glycosyltransferase family 4 protein [Verrucomicrobiaceae bacterium]|nr:glycosyltransferase family 4 protein [Verrucomicrobiaceae bacterium]